MKRVLFQSAAVVSAAWVFAFLPLRADAQIAINNDNQTYVTLTGSTVTMTGTSQLYITGTGTPMSGCTINLNSPDSWFFMTKLRPSAVNTSTYLSQIKVSGAAAALNTNCRIVQYGDGTVVIPHASTFAPLQVFTGPLFTGSSTSLSQYTAYGSSTLGGYNDNIASFKLKRGYTVTIAQNSAGTGLSKNYVAADGDIEVSVMPDDFNNTVSFVRVFPWRWTNKKGIGGDITSGLNVRWWYNWNLNQNSPLDEEYVAIRQKQYWPGLDQDWNARDVNHLLGYNEPDKSDQANMSVSAAIGSWPDLLNTGLRLGSPVTSDGGRSWWLYPFMSQADSAGLRVDYVAVHYYWCVSPSNPSLAASQMYNFLRETYDNTGGRPLWVTEWNQGAGWTGCGDPSSSQQAACIAAMIDMLDSTPWVERYAIFNWVEDVRRVKWDDGSLTSAGVAYRDQVSSIGYLQVAPWLPTPGAALYRFENDTRDTSGNGHAAVPHGKARYAAGHAGQALTLSGSAADDGYVSLSHKFGDSTDFTFGAWVYWNGGANWQRIFDLGNFTDSYMFLTPSSSSGTVRFGIDNGSTQQQINHSAPLPVNTWTHVAVTISGNTGKLFINGTNVATNTGMTINPGDLGTKTNYLGKSQWSSDPLFAGKLDDVQFIPYALSDANVARMMTNTPPQFTSPTIAGSPATQGVAYNSTIAGYCTDADAGETLAFSKFSGPSWLVVGADGTLSGTPTYDDEGTEEFLVRVTDSAGVAASVVLTITLPSVSGNGTWTSLTSGTWSDSSKWSSGFPANGEGFTANFSTLDITGDMTVSLERSRKIGGLSFGDTAPSHAWTLTSIGGSTLTLVPASGSPSLAVTSGTATLAVTLAGASGFTKTGSGTVVLNGDNALGGTVTLGGANASANNDGTVRVASPDSFTDVDAINIASNNSGSSILELDGSTRGITFSAPITLNGRNPNVPGIRSLSGSNTMSGAVTLQSGGSYYIFENNAGILNLTGNFTSAVSGSRLLTFQGDGDFNLTKVISNGSGTVSLLKTGTGSLTLAGNCSYTGSTTISAGSVTVSGSIGTGAITVASGAALNLNNTSALAQTVTGGGSINTAATTTVTGTFTAFSGTFTHNSTTNSVAFNNATATGGGAAYVLASSQGSLQGMIAGGSGNYTLQFGSLTGVANSLFRGGLSVTGTATLQIGGLNTSTSFDGSINNGQKVMALTKVGTGALTLGGANSYTGPTTLSTGSLVLNGSIASTAAMTAAAGTALSGTGSCASPIVISGTHAPGNPAGTQTFTGSMSYGAASRLKWTLLSNTAVTGAAGRVAAAGVTVTAGAGINLVFNGTGSTVDFTNNFWTQPQSWTVLAGSSVAGTFVLTGTSVDSSGRSPANYGTLALQHSGTSVVLNFTPYPPLEVWQRVNFGANWNNSAIAGNEADPDNDRIKNIFEYGLGMDPTRSDASPWTPGHAGLPVQGWQTVSGADYLCLQVRRPIGLTGITYSGEVSGDLANWTNAVQEGTPGSNGDGSETLILRDTVPKGEAGKRFIRLQITQP